MRNVCLCFRKTTLDMVFPTISCYLDEKCLFVFQKDDFRYGISHYRLLSRMRNVCLCFRKTTLDMVFPTIGCSLNEKCLFVFQKDDFRYGISHYRLLSR